MGSLGCLLDATTALAAEGDRAVSAGLGYAGFALVQDDDTRSAHGATLTLEYEHGLSDTLGLRFGASGGPFFRAKGTAWAGAGTVGITYTWDVIQLVPYVSGSLGAIVAGSGGIGTEVKPLLQLGVGVDWLRSRELSFGLAAQVEVYLADMVYWSVGPRVTYRWGYF